MFLLRHDRHLTEASRESTDLAGLSRIGRRYSIESDADDLGAEPDNECNARVAIGGGLVYRVLLDLSMPARTGLELIGDLRAIRADLPVLLMSGDHARYRPTPGRL